MLSVPSSWFADRSRALRSAYLPSPVETLDRLPATADPTLLAYAVRNLELMGDGPGVVALLAGFSARWPASKPLPVDLAAAVVDVTASRRAALRSRYSEVAAVVLQWLGPQLDDVGSCWQQLRPALLERLGTTRERGWSQAVNACAADIQARFAQRQVDSISGQMERMAELDRIMSSLVARIPARTVRDRVAVWGQIPLDRASLETIVLSHVVGLCKLDPGEAEGEDAALAVLTNLRMWFHEQLPALRDTWAAASMAEQGRGAPETARAAVAGADAALAESRRVLADAARAAGLNHPFTLPDALHVERSVNEGAQILATWAVEKWRRYPRVLAALFRSLSGIRSVRLRALGLVELGLEPSQPEPVQQATLEFARSFLTGLSSDAAWQVAPPLAVRGVDDARLDLLENEHRQAIEADETLRGRLAAVAWDATRPAAVREAALNTVLQTTPADQERRALLDRASRGDAPLIAALLRWIIDHRASDTLECLEHLAPRVRGELRGLHPLWLRALAATRSRLVPGLLENDLLGGDPEAAAVLQDMGAEHRLDGFRVRRDVRQRLVEEVEVNQRRRDAAAEALSEAGRAIKVSLDSDAARIEAALHAGEARAERVRFEIDATVVQFELLPLLDRIAQLVEEVLPPAQREASHRMEALAEARDSIRRQVDVVNDLSDEVKRLEKKAEKARAELQREVTRNQELKDELRSAQSKASRAESDLTNATNELSRAQQSTEEDAAARISTATKAVRRAGDDSEGAIRKVLKVKGKLDACEATQIRLRDEGNDAESQAVQLEKKIREASAQLSRLRDAEGRAFRSAHDAVEAVKTHVAELKRLRHEADQIERRARQLAGHHQQELARRRAQIEAEITQSEELARRSEHHRGRGLAQQQQAVRASDQLIALDQQNSTDLKVLEEKRPLVDAEAARLEVQAGADLRATRCLQRARQELNLDVDLLLNTLLRVQGEPTEEAARTGRRLGVKWDLPDLGRPKESTP